MTELPNDSGAPEEWLEAPEAAQLLGVSTRQLRRYRRAGHVAAQEGPIVVETRKVGTLYRRNDLERIRAARDSSDNIA